jgi:hypothetical protein
LFAPKGLALTHPSQTKGVLRLFPLVVSMVLQNVYKTKIGIIGRDLAECVQPLSMSATWDLIKDLHPLFVLDESKLVLLVQTRSTHVQHVYNPNNNNVINF